MNLIGLEETDLSLEGSWRWQESHQAPAYTNWDGNEPNGGDREDCVAKWSNKA